MLRTIFILIFLLKSSSIFGQSDSNFPSELIKKSKISSCTIKADTDTLANFREKYIFNKNGKIQTHSFPTYYHVSIDSVLIGVEINIYYYNKEDLLSKITQKIEFGADSIIFPEELRERFIYDQDNKLITHLFYFQKLTKVKTFQYKNKELISETIINLNDFSNLKSPKIETSKRFFQNTGWEGYDSKGDIKNGLETEIDSGNYKETHYYYNFKKNKNAKDNPEEYIYYFDNQWQLKKIIRKYNTGQIVEKFYRTDNGLLTKVEHSGFDLNYELIFEYKYYPD